MGGKQHLGHREEEKEQEEEDAASWKGEEADTDTRGG